MALHFHRLRVKDLRIETSECVSIAFEVPDQVKNEFRFIPGQNLTIKKTEGEQEIRRSYSICSSPSENELRIAVKGVPGGRFSAFANQELEVGDFLEVLPPTGNFYTALHPQQKKNYLAVAAGSGITPVISIIKSTLETEPLSRFTLVYGNKTRASIIFKEELENLKNKYISRFTLIHILSRETTDSPLFTGRIDAIKCQEIFSTLINIKTIDEFFLCGPEQLIFSVSRFLTDAGVSSHNIHFELFTIPGAKTEIRTSKIIVEAPEQHQLASVTVQLDGIATTFEMPFHGDSILNTALRTGMDLPFACKGGVCSTCKAKLKEGEVEMDNNYALGDDEIAGSFILTCQSHPRSEKVSISFDER